MAPPTLRLPWLALASALVLALASAGCLSDEGNKPGAPGGDPDTTEQMDSDPQVESEQESTTSGPEEEPSPRGNATDGA